MNVVAAAMLKEFGNEVRLQQRFAAANGYSAVRGIIKAAITLKVS
ncbi:hypothetical protein SDC9_198603 [bioreactor metagenome]|uniref:Uncharacterized protein n=1 Tax=bioreactor metagenome TaxID=1076179 RepID=A0A645IUX5_9ZZZZ